MIFKMYIKINAVIIKTNKLNKNFSFAVCKCYHSENGVYGYKKREQLKDTLSPAIIERRHQEPNTFRWIDAYRTHGHRIAKTNPIEIYPSNRDDNVAELDPKFYGLLMNQKISNLDGLLYNKNLSKNSLSISDLEKYLKNIYSSDKCSVEFNYVENIYEREWLAEKYENSFGENLSNERKVEIAEGMLRFQKWDHFMAIEFPTVKRYGGEGAESMVAFFQQLFLESVQANIQNIILGMVHRGKFNFLTTMLNEKPAKLFRIFKGHPEIPEEFGAFSDQYFKLAPSTDVSTNNGTIHVSVLRTPSHLEVNNPVVMGKTLSKQQSNEKTISVLAHTDAALPGQGINQECLMMNATPNFDVDGTIHMIVNNQVGFTQPGERSRGTRYCSDLAKSINAPVFHVNAYYPETFAKLTKIAFEYQLKFKKDIFIDFQCYRKLGHDEQDDPTLTNPSLYKIINNCKSIPDVYCNKLINDQVLSPERVKNVNDNFTEYLKNELENWESYVPEKSFYEKQWKDIKKATNKITNWDTGIDYTLLQHIGKTSVSFPPEFKIHPHLLKTHVVNRIKRLSEGKSIDWATAESLSIGSLLYQGCNVRLSGQDVGRGTFSHRHAMLVDQDNSSIYIPLNSLEGGCGGKFEVANSILSEEAVVGFEYGMAIDNPNNLIIWEAQFGDFFNGAQIMFDAYIFSGESKWMLANGLVILLPHGYDGAASEHSSCRIERFLQLTDSKETVPDGDDVNFNIVNPTTPAQYFHVLRRQIVRNFRKPLVVVAPKTLLWLPEATSNISDFEQGKSFQAILGDSVESENYVTRVIFCSGKHYYTLNNERAKRNIQNVAIIRIESLCPFPCNEIQQELEKYKSAREFIWAQEEPRNMGAWTFMKSRFENLIGKNLRYSGRVVAPTPAIGSMKMHALECETILQDAFA